MEKADQHGGRIVAASSAAMAQPQVGGSRGRRQGVVWDCQPVCYGSVPRSFMRQMLTGGSTMQRFVGSPSSWYVGVTLTLGLLAGAVGQAAAQLRQDATPATLGPQGQV